MLKVLECTSLEEMGSLRVEWSELVEGSEHASIFAGWEWAEAFWRYGVPGKKPIVLLARDERARLVGVLPLARTRRLRMLNQLEVLGCSENGYPLADYGGLLAERGVEGSVWMAMLRHMKERRWTVIDLQNCRTHGRDREGQTEGFYGVAAANVGWEVRVRKADMCRVIPLPATFQEYLAALSSNSRQNIRRKLRKLTDAGFKIEQIGTQDEARFNEAFDALVLYHQERWAQDPSGGGFPTQRSRDLQRHIARRLDAAEQLDLRVVRDPAEKIVGVMYNLRHNGVGYFYGLGVSQDDQYSPLSVGTCLMADSIAAAIEAGCHTFDLMRGDHDYKRHFGGYIAHNLRVTLYRHAWLHRAEEALRGLRARLRRPAMLAIDPALPVEQ